MSNYFGPAALDAFYATYHHEASARQQQSHLPHHHSHGSSSSNSSHNNNEAGGGRPKSASAARLRSSTSARTGQHGKDALTAPTVSSQSKRQREPNGSTIRPASARPSSAAAMTTAAAATAYVEVRPLGTRHLKQSGYGLPGPTSSTGGRGGGMLMGDRSSAMLTTTSTTYTTYTSSSDKKVGNWMAYGTGPAGSAMLRGSIESNGLTRSLESMRITSPVLQGTSNTRTTTITTTTSAVAGIDTDVLGPSYAQLRRIETSSLNPRDAYLTTSVPFEVRRPELLAAAAAEEGVGEEKDEELRGNQRGSSGAAVPNISPINTSASALRLRPMSAPLPHRRRPAGLSSAHATGVSVNAKEEDEKEFRTLVGAYLAIATKVPSNPGISKDISADTGGMSITNSASLQDVVDDTSPPVSPRTAYIRGCIESQQRPKPGLIIRRDVSGVMDLRGRGMGDAAALVFARSMQQMPHIHTLNISDNNLTDAGLTALFAAVVTMASLTRLDISNNKLDRRAAAALAKCLASSECGIVQLTLCDADIDDEECCKFISAIQRNNKVRDLDMSRNCIGSAENLNTVRPQFKTGSEALGQCIRSADCPLQTLRISWNKIRLDGAVFLSESLKYNSSLTYVDLSYNSLGAVAGEVLGGVVMENKTISTLLLGHNGIDSRACFTLCVGLQLNPTMRVLGIEGNPIGRDGARALLDAPIVIGSRTSLLSGGCNTSLRNRDFPLNRDAPSGTYSLDLSKPFQRALAIKLLSIVASNTSYLIKKFHFNPAAKSNVALPNKSRASPGRRESVKMPLGSGSGVLSGDIALIRTRLPLDLAILDAAKRAAVVALRRLVLASQNYAEAFRLFSAYDSDGSVSAINRLLVLVKSLV